MWGLERFSIKKKNSGEIKEEETCKYPIEELGKYVGEEIIVKSISLGKSKPPEKDVLKNEPNKDFFYLGNEEQYHIVHWYMEDISGNLSAVRSIEDINGNLIYENPEIPYDENNIKKSKGTGMKVDEIKNGE